MHLSSRGLHLARLQMIYTSSGFFSPGSGKKWSILDAGLGEREQGAGGEQGLPNVLCSPLLFQRRMQRTTSVMTIRCLHARLEAEGALHAHCFSLHRCAPQP